MSFFITLASVLAPPVLAEVTQERARSGPFALSRLGLEFCPEGTPRLIQVTYPSRPNNINVQTGNQLGHLFFHSIVIIEIF
jgi:hypothetical protein